MSNGPKIEEKKKFELPHIFILLFFIIVVCAILTWIIPAGLFDRVENESGRMIAVAGTWHKVDPTPVGPFKVFTCLYDGMVNAAEITLLVFLTFASTIFVTKSGAFDGLVSWMLKLFKGNSSLIIIPVFMVLFGIGSSTIGMFEEWLPFIPIFAAIFIGMGYDAITGLAVVALGAGMGYSGATMNPFTVGVAQGIAEVPYPSGVAFRIVVHAVMLIIASFFVMRYAKKVKADPTKSLVYGDDFSALLSSNEDGAEKEFGIKQKLVLLDLLVAIIVIVYGTKQLGWYFAEICATFVIMGIIAAIIMRFNLKEIGKIYDRYRPWYPDGPERRTDHRHHRLWNVPASVPLRTGNLRSCNADPADTAELRHSVRFRTGCCLHADHGSSG